MKKTLLFGLALGLSGLAQAQCVITGPDPVMCLTSAPVAMDVESPGATYSGPGVDGNIFSPAEAGVGTHTIMVEAPGEGYSIDEGIPYLIEPIPGGTPVFLSDDAVSGDLPIGFTFTYFGNDYTNFRFSSNGFITFPPENDNGCCSGENMPNASAFEPQNNIGICWDDLNPPTGGTLRYETIGSMPNRILVADWSSVRHFGSSDIVTGQIRLYETTNCVEVHVTTQNETAGSHTLGMQNMAGDEAYVAPGKNATGWTASNFAIQFCPNVGCTGEFEVEVVESPNVFGAADVEEICLGEEITLTASGDADTYDWGSEINDGEAFAPEAVGENVYIVAGEDLGTGCVGTAMVNVFVHDIPYVGAGLDTGYCADWEFTLNGVSDDPAVTFEWDNGAIDGEPMLQDVGTVTYTVIGTNAGDCEASDEVTIESYEVPTGTGVVTMMTGMGYDGEIDFDPSGGTGGPYTFLWSNGETTEDINSLPVGSYTVTVSDGRCDSDVTFMVDSQAGIALNELGNLKVYPNPVVNQFTVEFEGTYNWTLFDHAGKMIANGQATGKEEIDMSEFAAGSYIMEVEVDGKKSTVPLVKE